MQHLGGLVGADTDVPGRSEIHDVMLSHTDCEQFVLQVAQEPLMSMHIHQQAVFRIGSSCGIGNLKARIVGRCDGGGTFGGSRIATVTIQIIPNNGGFRVIVTELGAVGTHVVGMDVQRIFGGINAYTQITAVLAEDAPLVAIRIKPKCLRVLRIIKRTQYGLSAAWVIAVNLPFGLRPQADGGKYEKQWQQQDSKEIFFNDH